MNIEEKKVIAKRIYKICDGHEYNEFEIVRKGELYADLLYPKGGYKGLSLIISDDGSYLLCDSSLAMESNFEKFKQGARSNIDEEE